MIENSATRAKTLRAMLGAVSVKGSDAREMVALDDWLELIETGKLQVLPPDEAPKPAAVPR